MESTEPTLESIESYCVRHSTPVARGCDEIEVFTRANNELPQMLIGKLEGSFLKFLVGLNRTKSVLEVGCFTGYSSLCMAEQLPSDGELITLDINPETTRQAEGFWSKSPFGKKIRAIVGDALVSMSNLKREKKTFDLIFLDGHKPDYIDYLKNGLDLLSPRGLIVADNCLWSGRVLQPEIKADEETKGIILFNRFVREHKNLECVLLPIRDGMMLIRRF